MKPGEEAARKSVSGQDAKSAKGGPMPCPSFALFASWRETRRNKKARGRTGPAGFGVRFTLASSAEQQARLPADAFGGGP
jgi:hypothetical protein